MHYRDPVDPITAIDILEPLDDGNDYRDAGIAYLRIVSLALSHILEADNPQVAALGVSYALGLISVVGNETQREAARRLNLSHGTISYHARLFGRKAGLPPSALMKSEEQADISREARHRYVARGEAAPSPLKN